MSLAGQERRPGDGCARSGLPPTTDVPVLISMSRIARTRAFGFGSFRLFAFPYNLGVMNLSRMVRELAEYAAMLLRRPRPVPSIETAVETIRRFQEGKLTERDSDAIADALIRFH